MDDMRRPSDAMPTTTMIVIAAPMSPENQTAGKAPMARQPKQIAMTAPSAAPLCTPSVYGRGQGVSQQGLKHDARQRQRASRKSREQHPRQPHLEQNLLVRRLSRPGAREGGVAGADERRHRERKQKKKRGGADGGPEPAAVYHG